MDAGAPCSRLVSGMLAPNRVSAHHPAPRIHPRGVMPGHPDRAHAGGVPDPDEQPPPLPSAAPARSGCLYAISIRGRVGPSMLAAFGSMQVSTIPGHTVLRGLLEDQAALYGVLERIAALGLELEEVRRLPGPSGG